MDPRRRPLKPPPGNDGSVVCVTRRDPPGRTAAAVLPDSVTVVRTPNLVPSQPATALGLRTGKHGVRDGNSGVTEVSHSTPRRATGSSLRLSCAAISQTKPQNGASLAPRPVTIPQGRPLPDSKQWDSLCTSHKPRQLCARRLAQRSRLRGSCTLWAHGTPWRSCTPLDSSTLPVTVTGQLPGVGRHRPS